MEKARQSLRKQKNKLIAFFAILTIAVGILVWHSMVYYGNGTIIEGVDCSQKTIEEAKDLIEAREIQLSFADGNTYKVQAKDLGKTLEDESELRRIIAQQGILPKGTREFKIPKEAFSVDKVTLNTYLISLRELNPIYMRKPQNAYIQMGTDSFEIVPEEYGTVIDLGIATNFAKEKLLSGETTINFGEITEKDPEILQTDKELNAKLDALNKTLTASITLTLQDESTVTLDSNQIKNWVYQDEKGNYEIAIEENVEAFVKELEARVKEIGKTQDYKIESGEVVTLNVQWGSRTTLDTEKEKAELMKELNIGGTYERKPNYSQETVITNLTDYIDVSIEEQKVKMYVGGECILNAPCVTGTKGVYDTPKGIFYSNFKAKDYHLSKYNCDVEYWVTVDGNVGLHDANWRTDDEYTVGRYTWDGSHGCINLQEATAQTIYENVTSKML